MHSLRQWADDTEIIELRVMEAKALGDLIHMNEKHGAAVREAALMFPTVAISFELRPLSHDLLQISVHVEPSFHWNAKISASGEPFYVWIQDEAGLNILQWRSILVRPTTSSLAIDFVIPIGDTVPPSYTVISASDRWLGSDIQMLISLDALVMPQAPVDQTPLLNIPYLSVACFDDAQLEKSYRAYITTLNGIQSQAFWTFYHTQSNALVSAPVASGKSLLGEAAIW